MNENATVKELVNKTIHVFVLDYETKHEIKQLLEIELSKTFSGNELDEYIDNGMDSRLVDLEEVIDIYNLETIEVH